MAIKPVTKGAVHGTILLIKPSLLYLKKYLIRGDRTCKTKTVTYLAYRHNVEYKEQVLLYLGNSL